MLTLAAPAFAQERRTWPTCKAELTTLSGQIEQLRNELVRTGAAGGPADARRRPALTRLDQLEAELQAADRPGRRADQRRDPHHRGRHQPGRRHRVPPDRARGRRHRRGGKPEPALLGGGVTRPMPRPVAPAVAPPGSRHAGGVPSSRTSTPRWRRRMPATTPRRPSSSRPSCTSYPGGPLSTEAQYRRGEALGGAGELARRGAELSRRLQRRAAGPRAPHALYKLAVSLGELGQTDEACLTLTEVDSRYPDPRWRARWRRKRLALACQ